MSELTRLSATALAALVQARDVSCAEVVEATLTQIARVEPELNAFASVDADGALETARRLDKRLADGDCAGVLCGVPFTVKDLLHLTSC